MIEDAAQAIGSLYYNKPSGSFGKIGCFSTHPLKNLNACGDGGFITCNDRNIYERADNLRSHGLVNRNKSTEFGFVSRMDSVQAAILNYRLIRLDEYISKRRENAEFYFSNLNSNYVKLPYEKKLEFNTYHTFVIQVKRRDNLKEWLSKQGIETAIHYPTPIHLQPAAKNLGYNNGDFIETEKQSKSILTLPINQNLEPDEIMKIVSAVNQFFN